MPWHATKLAIALTLLLFQWLSPLVAQTHLSTSQIPPLKGSVTGNFSSTVLRDLNSAVDHGNHISDAIDSAIRDCPAVIPCSITVPAFYGPGEILPGYQLSLSTPTSGATTAQNVSIFDRRYGESRMFVNNNGFPSGLLRSPTAWVYNYYSRAPAQTSFGSLNIRQWSLDGGNNQQTSYSGYTDKSTWVTFSSNDVSHTPGQHLNLALGIQSTSVGDTIGFANHVGCYGGSNAQGDLGCRSADNLVVQGAVEYSGSVSGYAFTGARSVSVLVSQGSYTQGSGRFLVKTASGTISSGSISGLTNNFPTRVVGSATSWPISNVIAQLGTNVSVPGTETVTPLNFSVGSMSGLSSSSLVCIADQQSFEMLNPVAVTSTGFTANFTKIHPSDAILSSGGVCGYLLDLTADDVVNSTFPIKTQTIIGTLHFAWPMIASSTATSASIWVTGGGGWQSAVTRWKPQTLNAYVMYPFAEVLSTQQSGGLSDTLTLGPNNVAWSTGDSVSEFLYPSVHNTFGNNIIESYYPNISSTDLFGFTYNAPMQGNEALMTLANNAPVSFYGSGGGTFDSPTGIRLTGQTSRVVSVDQPGDAATFAIGCSSCLSIATVLAVGNSEYYDFLWYDQANKNFALSANASNALYSWKSNLFGTPFSNVFFGVDSRNSGFIGAQQWRSGSSVNSDVSGELSFSNTVSATYNLQASYTNHPECVARPQFDQGPTNRHWISFSASSFTITFATPVTGLVIYSCIGRA